MNTRSAEADEDLERTVGLSKVMVSVLVRLLANQPFAATDLCEILSSRPCKSFLFPDVMSACCRWGAGAWKEPNLCSPILDPFTCTTLHSPLLSLLGSVCDVMWPPTDEFAGLLLSRT